MSDMTKQALTKVPAVTLGFWVIKVLATTLGETGGDTVSMTMNLGYLVGTAIFLGALLVLVVLQIRQTIYTHGCLDQTRCNQIRPEKRKAQGRLTRSVTQ